MQRPLVTAAVLELLIGALTAMPSLGHGSLDEISQNPSERELTPLEKQLQRSSPRVPSVRHPCDQARGASYADAYNVGKLAAQTLVIYEARLSPQKKGALRQTMKTRKAVFSAAIIAAEQMMGRKASDTLLECTAANTVGPWSPFHSGFTDYLSPDLKQIFLSVPER